MENSYEVLREDSVSDSSVISDSALDKDKQLEKEKDSFAVRFRIKTFSFVDKTKTGREAASESVAKFLSIGWPGFAAAFLYGTMAAALPGVIMLPGLIFMIASLTMGVLGLASNIGMLKYNKRKSTVENLLTSKEVDNKINAQSLNERVIKLEKELAEYNKLQAQEGTHAIMKVGKMDYSAKSSSTANLYNRLDGAIDPQHFQNSLDKKIEALQKDITTFEKNAKAVQKAIKANKKFAPWRNLAFTFQALSTAVGMAGLPFFIFLSLNALSIAFLSSVILVSVIVGVCAVWGLYCGISFIRDTYKDVKTHEANTNELTTKVSELTASCKVLNDLKNEINADARLYKELTDTDRSISPNNEQESYVFKSPLSRSNGDIHLRDLTPPIKVVKDDGLNSNNTIIANTVK